MVIPVVVGGLVLGAAGAAGGYYLYKKKKGQASVQGTANGSISYDEGTEGRVECDAWGTQPSCDSDMCEWDAPTRVCKKRDAILLPPPMPSAPILSGNKLPVTRYVRSRDNVD